MCLQRIGLIILTIMLVIIGGDFFIEIAATQGIGTAVKALFVMVVIVPIADIFPPIWGMIQI